MIIRGFMLFEVCIACAIFACMILMGMHVYTIYESILVKSEALVLKTALYSAAQRAMLSNNPLSIYFDTIRNGYVTEGIFRPLANGVIFGASASAYGPPSAPERPIIDPITFVKHTAVCAVDGTMQPGTIYITDDKRQCTYALTVPIGNYSYLRLYRYKNNSSRGKWEQL